MKRLFTSTILLLTFTVNAQLIDFSKADDRLHISLGMFAGQGGIILNENTLQLDCKICVSTGTALLAGAAKETIDSMSKNNRFDAREMFLTGLGGVISWGLYKIGVPPIITLGLSVAYIGAEMTFKF